MATEEKKFPYRLDGDALYRTYREQYTPGDRTVENAVRVPDNYRLTPPLGSRWRWGSDAIGTDMTSGTAPSTPSGGTPTITPGPSPGAPATGKPEPNSSVTSGGPNTQSLYEQYLERLSLGDKPGYAGTWDRQLADLYDKIAGRPAFSYDVGKDPLYGQYRDSYIQQGKLAMKDTMGQAAALTGGYGSTYGQAVGQQTYDAYLQKLGDVVPELYEKAYGRYRDEGEELMKQYALMGQQRDTEYSLYRDALGDWENERAYQTQRETEDYNRRTAEAERAYQRGQDELTQRQKAYSSLYALIAASGYRPTDEELAAAGMTRAAADALAAEYQRGVDMENQQLALQQAARAASGGGGGGGRSSGGGRSYTGSARSESSPDTKISAPGKSYTNNPNLKQQSTVWNPKAAVAQTVAQKAAPVRAATSAALGLADKLKKKR